MIPPDQTQADRHYHEALAFEERRVRLDRLCVIAAGLLPVVAHGMSLRDDLDDHVLAVNVSRVSRAILAKLEEE